MRITLIHLVISFGCSCIKSFVEREIPLQYTLYQNLLKKTLSNRSINDGFWVVGRIIFRHTSIIVYHSHFDLIVIAQVIIMTEGGGAQNESNINDCN